MTRIGTLPVVIAILGAALLVVGLVFGGVSFAPRPVVAFVSLVLLGAAYEARRQWA